MAQDPLARSVPCPGCRQPAPLAASNPWRPFCSQRCRGTDLGDWANERFRLPAETPPDHPQETTAH